MANMKGIDISHWQGIVNFNKVRDSGVQAVYIKATEGLNYIDPSLKQFYQGAKATGLKVGFYHFFRAKNEANAVQQAQHFADAIQGMDHDCRPALDIETTEGLGKATLSNLAKVFLDKVQQLAGPAVLYTYTSFVNESLNSVLAPYPLWVANYRSGSPGSNSVWGAKWVGWQYSDKGSVPGVKGNVDLDWFTTDILKKDVNKVSDYAAKAWQKAVDKKVFDGSQPGAPVTREMLAVVLDNLGLLEKEWTPEHAALAKQMGVVGSNHDPNAAADKGFAMAIGINVLKVLGK